MNGGEAIGVRYLSSKRHEQAYVKGIATVVVAVGLEHECIAGVVLGNSVVLGTGGELEARARRVAAVKIVENRQVGLRACAGHARVERRKKKNAHSSGEVEG